MAAVVLLASAVTVTAYVIERWTSGGKFSLVEWRLRGTNLPNELSRHLDSEVAVNPQLNGELMHLSAPAVGLDQSFASGSSRSRPERALSPTDSVRIASATKTFVAVAVLRLVEQQKLDLDSPIAALISPQMRYVLERGGYRPRAITLRHLLTHTSGIPDFAQTRAFELLLIADDLLGRSRRWTRLEQVEFAMDHASPIDEPGKTFAYSDTGYVIVGEIIERATGRTLAESVRYLANLDALGLTSIYWEGAETAPPNMPRARQFIGKVDLTRMDPSMDTYGGGGLVGNMRDLTHFYRALLKGMVLKDQRSLALMQMPLVSNPAGYGMGLYRIRIADETCWGHTGYWGTAAFHCPKSDVAFARSVQQTNAPFGDKVFAQPAAAVIDSIGALRVAPNEQGK